MQPGSLVDMTGGTWRQSANRTTEIGGEVVVDAALESIVQNRRHPLHFRIRSTADVTLNGNLRLDSGVTRIEAGATFTGPGRLINAAGRRLEANHQADIGVIVENQGLYSNSGDDAGRNDMHTFVQTTSGTFRVDIQGTAASQFDRLQIDNQAQLAGSLELVLGGGYSPALGDTLSIISAAGGVTGTFSNVVQPTGMPAGLIVRRHLQSDARAVDGRRTGAAARRLQSERCRRRRRLRPLARHARPTRCRSRRRRQRQRIQSMPATTTCGAANFGAATIASSVAAELANDATVPEPHTWCLLSFIAGIATLLRRHSGRSAKEISALPCEANRKIIAGRERVTYNRRPGIRRASCNRVAAYYS